MSLPPSGVGTFRFDSSAGDTSAPAGGSDGFVSRLDFGRLDAKIDRTPQGGIRVAANLTREGVFEYRQADGTVRRELRPAEEVFKADSLATLKDAPVTDLHPQGMVDPTNYRTLSVGHVGGDVRKDGTFVAASVVIQDKDTVAAVERRDRVEVSCGYTCRLDATPGTWNGQAYDAVQRDIRYNHAALGPRNWGRAGASVALRLDSSVAVQATSKENDPMKKITVDGVEFEVSEAFAQAFAKFTARVDSEKAEAQKAIDGSKAEAAAAVKAKDEATARADSAEADLKKIHDAEAQTARVALEASAKKILGDKVAFDGKSDREIKVEVLKARLPDVDVSNRSDDYVAALFDAEARKDSASPADARVAIVRSQLPPKTPAQQPAKAPWERDLAFHK